MKVIIMRGLPGSGKSTWVKNNHPLAIVRSADQYFNINMIGPDGKPTWEYRFDPTQLGRAHNWCLYSYLQSLHTGMGNPNITLIVDNTNIKVFEIAPYYRLAEAFGAEVEIVWCQCDPATAIKRGIHRVPENKVWEMWKSFEALPPWWNVRYVNTDEKESG